MKLSRRHHGSDRRRYIINERLVPSHTEETSAEMQRAIEETRERIKSAFADGGKIAASLEQSPEHHIGDR